MPEYIPTYRTADPLTLDRFRSELEELRSMHLYATHHDDLLVLDELFCRVVTLEHRVKIWNESQQLARVRDSVKALNRALKWAWLAREEEEHTSGMYAGKMKEAIAVLQDMELFLESVAPPEDVKLQVAPPEQPGEIEQPVPLSAEGMSKEQAETLAGNIKARLPQAELEILEDDQTGAWLVQAHNPRRGTSQIFRDPEQFEQLMEQAAQRASSSAEQG